MVKILTYDDDLTEIKILDIPKSKLYKKAFYHTIYENYFILSKQTQKKLKKEVKKL